MGKNLLSGWQQILVETFHYIFNCSHFTPCWSKKAFQNSISLMLFIVFLEDFQFYLIFYWNITASWGVGIFIFLFFFLSTHRIHVHSFSIIYWHIYIYIYIYKEREWESSRGQYAWLLTKRSRVRFPAFPKFWMWIRFEMRSTQIREDNWLATWLRSSGSN